MVGSTRRPRSVVWFQVSSKTGGRPFFSSARRRVGAVEHVRLLAREQRQERIDGVRRHHQQDDRLVAPDELLVAQEVVVRHGRRDGGDLLEEQAVAVGERDRRSATARR